MEKTKPNPDAHFAKHRDKRIKELNKRRKANKHLVKPGCI